jgi:ParB/RepB/Spo0J family partition protein
LSLITRTKPEKVRKAPDQVKRLYDLAVGRFDGIRMDPRDLRIQPGFNPRNFTDVEENLEDFQSLKASIKVMGVLVPLLVRFEAGNKQGIIVGGERRERACLELIDEYEKSGGTEGKNIISVPVIQVSGDEKRLAMIALVENNHKALSQIECGKGYQSLLDLGAGIEEIATGVGRSLRSVSECLALYSAPLAVKELVEVGKVTPTAALQATKKHGDAAGKVLQTQVAASNGKKVTRKADAHTVTARDKVRILTETLVYLSENAATISARTIKSRVKDALEQIA